MGTTIIWTTISIGCEDPSALKETLTGFFKGRGTVDEAKKILKVRVPPENNYVRVKFDQWCDAENVVFTGLNTAVVKAVETALA